MEGVIGITTNLFMVIFLVLLNGFFVAAEFAIVKVRSTRIAQIGTPPRENRAESLGQLDAYLSATQLGITLASLGLGWIGEPAIARMLEPLLSHFGFPDWLIHTTGLCSGFFHHHLSAHRAR